MSSRFQVSLLLGVYLRCYSHGKCINTSGRLAVPLTLSAEGQIQLRLAFYVTQTCIIRVGIPGIN